MELKETKQNQTCLPGPAALPLFTYSFKNEIFTVIRTINYSTYVIVFGKVCVVSVLHALMGDICNKITQAVLSCHVYCI